MSGVSEFRRVLKGFRGASDLVLGHYYEERSIYSLHLQEERSIYSLHL